MEILNLSLIRQSTKMYILGEVVGRQKKESERERLNWLHKVLFFSSLLDGTKYKNMYNNITMNSNMLCHI